MDANGGEPDIMGALAETTGSVVDNFAGLTDALVDPLGIKLEVASSVTEAAENQGVSVSTVTNMNTLFPSQFAVFCYLVFILLYAPCVAVLGAMVRESGWGWMLISFGWTTSLAYVTSSCLYQFSMLDESPIYALGWIAGCAVFMTLFVRWLKSYGQKTYAHLIPVAQVAP